jgi:uncharacterized protein YjbI with pentapeptide repeats
VWNNVEQDKKSRKQSRRSGIAKQTGFGDKTIWDWLELLIVPLVLVLIGLAFSVQQEARQQRFEDERAETERELEEQRAQDLALQAYLDQMSVLLLEDLGDPKLRTLARARTLTVLRRLDPNRKEEVMRFLSEADLVSGDRGEDPVIVLNGADLRDVNLSGADLHGADLQAADLHGADLSSALVSVSDLSNADLSNATLYDATVFESNLSYADLSYSDLRIVDLTFSDLSYADLSHANMYGADLREASLSITNEELEQQAGSVEGATMPDGSKHD